VRRIESALLVAVVASCAEATVSPPMPDGGSGGTGGMGASASSAVTVGTGGSVVVDAGPNLDFDAGPCAPFVDTFVPACFVCLAASCCDVAAQCFAVSDCFAYAGCQQNCPPNLLDAGNGCLDACTQTYPMAEPTFDALTACLHTSCAGVCPY
jgi:hypothetical protein